MSLLLFDDDDDAGAASSPAAVDARDPIIGQLANGARSLVFDPITRDLIDTDDGWFLESTDSRTAVLFQLEARYAAWWADPTAGSRIRAIIAGDEPPTPLELRDEVLRALQPLVTEQMLSDLAVALDEDEVGRPAVLISYRDRSGGHPVDLAYVPFGG